MVEYPPMGERDAQLDQGLRFFCMLFSTGEIIPNELALSFLEAVRTAALVKSRGQPGLVDEVTSFATVNILRAIKEGRYTPTKVPVFAYLLIITGNAVISQGLKDKRIGEREPPLVDDLFPNRSVGLHRPVEEEVESNIFWDQVLAVINQLPFPNNKILAMDALGCTNWEISEACGISVKGVKSRLHRARRKMREEFRVDGDFAS